MDRGAHECGSSGSRRFETGDLSLRVNNIAVAAKFDSLQSNWISDYCYWLDAALGGTVEIAVEANDG